MIESAEIDEEALGDEDKETDEGKGSQEWARRKNDKPKEQCLAC